MSNPYEYATRDFQGFTFENFLTMVKSMLSQPEFWGWVFVAFLVIVLVAVSCRENSPFSRKDHAH